MTRTWEHDIDQMIYVSGDDWLEYGTFGRNTYGLHTHLDGREVAIRIDAESSKDAMEEADELLDKMQGGWRAVNWDDGMCSITEAAETLGLTRQRVHAMLKSGILKGEKIGNTWMVTKDSVYKRL